MSSWLEVIALLVSTGAIILTLNTFGYITITEEDNNYTIQMNERLNDFCESKNMTFEYFCDRISLFGKCSLGTIECKDQEDKIMEFKPNLTRVFSGIKPWCEMKGWCK